MRSGLVVASAFALLACALLAQSIALPARVMACSCLPDMPSLREMAAEGNVAVITGTVGVALPDRTPVAVEAWFHGAAPSDMVWLSGGTREMTSCDIQMTAGERRFLLLHADRSGIYSASSCSPHALLGTPEGDALVAEAVAAFGAGEVPPPPPAPPQAPFDASRWFGVGSIWIAGAVAMSLLLFGLIILAGTRRRAR